MPAERTRLSFPALLREIKPAITQNVNGSRQILGFAACQRSGDSEGFLLLTKARPGGMVRRTFASF
jgi:hypothetical protein